MESQRTGTKETNSLDKPTSCQAGAGDPCCLPTQQTVYCEMLPKNFPTKSEVMEIKNFSKQTLRKVEFVDKSVLPTEEVIKEELADSRSEVLTFKVSSLKHVTTKESTGPPSINELRADLLPEHLPTRPELEKLQSFVKSFLRHVEVVEKNVLPSAKDIEEESRNTFGQITTLDRSAVLKPTNTVEKCTLPSLTTLWEEMIPSGMPTKPELQELLNFVSKDLRHVVPNVKYVLPTADVIKEEMVGTLSEVKAFDVSSLRKTDTVEKSRLPSSADLWSELLPDYVPPKPEVEALNKFIRSTLKHSVTLEKAFLPTAKDIANEKSELKAE